MIKAKKFLAHYYLSNKLSRVKEDIDVRYQTFTQSRNINVLGKYEFGPDNLDLIVFYGRNI